MPGSIPRDRRRAGPDPKIAERGVTILVIEHLMKVVLLARATRAGAASRPADRRGPGRTQVVRDPRVIEAYLGQKFARRFNAEAANAEVANG